MLNQKPEFLKQAQLRLDAENRLRQGSAPPTRSGGLGADTLALLYRLASVPDTAGDALKLLSELQTHQVELDLQHGQLEADQQELVEALAHYQALYDFAPVGYLVVGLDGRILESNRAGAELLGTGTGGLAGQPIAALFSQDSRPAVLGLIEALREGTSGVCCEVVSSKQGGGPDPLHITASLAPGDEAALMIISRR